MRGWINYFAIADMKKSMTQINKHLRVMMRVIIWKQWKVPKKREGGLKKHVVKPWLAHEVSYVREYMKATGLPQIKRAISKERLTRRGLVSPLDYYLERHALKLS